jgi:hypothetical protein
MRTYSRDFMDTYNATHVSPELAAIVNRQPTTRGGYTIAAEFYCTNFLGCEPPGARYTLDEFNRTVALAGGN